VPKSQDRNAEFTRHVRRMERAERMRTAAPFAAAGLLIAGLLGWMAWNSFSTEACGTVTGVVEAARSEQTPFGVRHFLMVKGDDQRSYYSADPQDRPNPEGARAELAKNCTHSGAPRPMAHFDRWL